MSRGLAPAQVSRPSAKDDLWTCSRTQHGLANNSVRAVAVDSGGRRWLGTSGGGPGMLDDGGTPHDRSDDAWMTFSETDGLASRNLTSLSVDGQGRVWVGTLEGLSVLDHKGTPLDKADDGWTTFQKSDGLPDDDIYDVAVDGLGHVWLATDGGGLIALDHADTVGDKSDDIWTQFGHTDGLANKLLSAVAADDVTQLCYAGTQFAGISRLEHRGTIATKADDTWTQYATNDPLPDNVVSALLAEGSPIWVSMTGGGLCATDGASWTCRDAQDGLSSNYVYGLARGEAVLWIGTSDGIGALEVAGTPYDKAGDQWQNWRSVDAPGLRWAYGLALDPASLLWTAAPPIWTGSAYEDGGLLLLNDGGTPLVKSDDQWEAFGPIDHPGLNGWAYEVACDGYRLIWTATVPFWTGSVYEAGGLLVLDHRGTPFEKADDRWATFTTTHGLASDWVNALTVEDSDLLWVGTNSGLCAFEHCGTPFDTADDQWTCYGTADGLLDPAVEAIERDGQGRLWLGTRSGLNLLDPRGSPHVKSDDVWTSWRVEDGLVDRVIDDVAIDGSGSVWVASGSGLGRAVFGRRF